jgi:hypothetical protein
MSSIKRSPIYSAASGQHTPRRRPMPRRDECFAKYAPEDAIFTTMLYAALPAADALLI